MIFEKSSLILRWMKHTGTHIHNSSWDQHHAIVSQTHSGSRSLLGSLLICAGITDRSIDNQTYVFIRISYENDSPLPFSCGDWHASIPFAVHYTAGVLVSAAFYCQTSAKHFSSHSYHNVHSLNLWQVRPGHSQLTKQNCIPFEMRNEHKK